MKILVTGATGFIGANVVRALQAKGYHVRALVRDTNSLNLMDTGIEVVAGDIRDKSSVVDAITGCQGVIHCAARYKFWSQDPGLMYQTNVEGTENVLECALETRVERCVYTSTVSTVGVPRDGVGDELTKTSDHDMVGHYKRSKFQTEEKALEMVGRGLLVVVVNPTAPVGPWDVKPTPTGSMVLDFIRGRIPAYIDTGMNVVDVEDVAVGHVQALEKGRPGERYILGNKNMTLHEIFRVLERVSDVRAPRLRLPTWMVIGAGYIDGFVEGKLLRREPTIPVEGLKVSRKPMYVKCDKAVNELGMPQSPIQEAFEKAVGWFRQYGYA